MTAAQTSAHTSAPASPHTSSTASTSMPATPSSRPRHRREDIITAACTLLNEGGLASLTMRRLAAQLNVQPSALYWHFADKQTLLAAMSSHVLSTATLDEATAPLPWEGKMRAAAARVRECLMSYTDGAELVSSSLALGRVELPVRAQLADVLRAEGASETAIDLIASTLGHYVVGATFHEQQRQSMAALDASAPDAEDIGREQTVRTQADREFTQGVELIIAGAAVLLSMGTHA